jgi:hypothetical protein
MVEYFPDVHNEQVEAPIVDENVPAMQLRQVLLSTASDTSETFPA